MDKDFYRQCEERNRNLQNEYNFNRRNICENYEQEFTILEGFFDFSIEVGGALDKCIPQPEKPFLQFALLRIHERALKVARESKILLENGSASGAMARWRTLFEFSVVSTLLIKDPQLAKKYIEYAAIDDYKCAKKLVEYRDRLNLNAYNSEVFCEIKSKYDTVKKKYGWTGKKDYEWAINEEIKAPNLFELAKAVNLEHLYAYVDEAHKYNHPSMRYLLNDRGTIAPEDDTQHYLFTPFGMELPIQLIAISLYQINFSVINGYIQLDLADVNQMLFYLQQNDEFPKAIVELISDKLQKQEEENHAD